MNMDHFERGVDPATGWGTEEPTEDMVILPQFDRALDGTCSIECAHGNRMEVRFEGKDVGTVEIARLAFECGCSMERAPQRSPSRLERLLWRFQPPIA